MKKSQSNDDVNEAADNSSHEPQLIPPATVVALTDIEEVDEESDNNKHASISGSEKKGLSSAISPTGFISDSSRSKTYQSELTPLNQVTFAPSPPKHQTSGGGILHSPSGQKISSPSSPNATSSPGNNLSTKKHLHLIVYFEA